MSIPHRTGHDSDFLAFMEKWNPASFISPSTSRVEGTNHDAQLGIIQIVGMFIIVFLLLLTVSGIIC